MFRALIDDITRAGGAAGRAHLVSLGHNDRALRAAVQAGVIARPRRGWYSVWADSDPRTHALRVGGRLTGLSAIAAMGGWVRRRGRMHVAVPVNASRLRCPRRRTVTFARSPRRSQVVIHWTRETHDRDRSSGCVGVVEALEVALATEAFEDAVAAVDWARRSGHIDVIDAHSLVQRVPHRARLAVESSSERCHSLPESLARTRLVRLGLHVDEQVVVPDDPSPVDLVIEGAVGLEVDGDQFHRDRFARDRSKDLVMTVGGLHAIRPAARHIFHDWPLVEAAILTALAARGVSLPPRPVALVDNSGQRRRYRRPKRVHPRSSSPRPRTRARLS
jgi:very-short-patch-repair endonuclease